MSKSGQPWLKPLRCQNFIKWRPLLSLSLPMSIFVRPESPPPRQPSPDITLAPLPYPHHPRRATSQPKIRVYSPSRPPGLHPPTRTVQPARSYDHITRAHDDHNSLIAPRKRTYTSSEAHADLNSRYGSTLTVAVTRRSSVHVCPIPNPPASAASGSKRTLRPQPHSFDSLYHIDEMGVNQRKSPSKPALPPLEKHKNLGMACLRLFRFRNSSRC